MPVARRKSTSDTATTVTDAHGGFALKARPGRYMLVAAREAFDVARLDLSLTAGRVDTATMSMTYRACP